MTEPISRETFIKVISISSFQKVKKKCLVKLQHLIERNIHKQILNEMRSRRNCFYVLKAINLLRAHIHVLNSFTENDLKPVL